MDNRSRNNGKKPVNTSKNDNSKRKSGISVPASSLANKSLVKRPAQSAPSQAVSAQTSLPKQQKTAVKKRTNSVVGMNNRKPKQMRAVRKPKIITIRKKERTPFPISTVFTSIIITALFLFMMMNYAELDKNNGELAQLENKITKLEDVKRDLSVKLDKKDNLMYIEDKIEEFGMVKKEKLPSIVVEMQPKDKSEIIKYDNGEEGGFGFLLAGIGDVINGFLE